VPDSLGGRGTPPQPPRPEDETWRSEWLDRLPTKIAPGRVLVHNRVRPAQSHTKPGRDGFYAWIWHPVDPDHTLDLQAEVCVCGWMTELGNHYILAGGPIGESQPDLRVDDLLGPNDGPSGGVREPRRPLPSSGGFKLEVDIGPD
jgi:hypothetical protein